MKRKRRVEKRHNEKLHNLYSSRNNVQVIRSRKMNCVGHVPHMGGIKNALKIAVRKPKLNTWKDLCIDGSIILKWV
jgi:hypothetical protein